jgi:hypothetical protein
VFKRIRIYVFLVCALCTVAQSQSVEVPAVSSMTWRALAPANAPLVLNIPVDFSSGGGEVMSIVSESPAAVSLQLPDGSTPVPNVQGGSIQWMQSGAENNILFGAGLTSGILRMTVNSAVSNALIVSFRGNRQRNLSVAALPSQARPGQSVALFGVVSVPTGRITPFSLSAAVTCVSPLRKIELTPTFSLVSSQLDGGLRTEIHQLTLTNNTTTTLSSIRAMALIDWPSTFEGRWDADLSYPELGPGVAAPIAKLTIRMPAASSFNTSMIDWRLDATRSKGNFLFTDDGTGRDATAGDLIFTSSPITVTEPANCHADVVITATDAGGVQFSRRSSTSFSFPGDFGNIQTVEDRSFDRNGDGAIDQIGARVRVNISRPGKYWVSFAYRQIGSPSSVPKILQFRQSADLTSGEHVIEATRSIFEVKADLGPGQYERGPVALKIDDPELGFLSVDTLPGSVLTPTFSASMFPADRLTAASLSNLQAVASGSNGTLFDKVQVNLNFQLSAPAESCGYSLQLSSPTSGTTSPEVNANFSVESNTHSAANQATTIVFNFGPILPGPDRNRTHHYTITGLPSTVQALNATGQSQNKPYFSVPGGVSPRVRLVLANPSGDPVDPGKLSFVRKTGPLTEGGLNLGYLGGSVPIPNSMTTIPAGSYVRNLEFPGTAIARSGLTNSPLRIEGARIACSYQDALGQQQQESIDLPMVETPAMSATAFASPPDDFALIVPANLAVRNNFGNAQIPINASLAVGKISEWKPVTFSTTALPPGLSLRIDPQVLIGGTMYITLRATNAVPGVYPITISATDGFRTKTYQTQVTIQPQN